MKHLTASFGALTACLAAALCMVSFDQARAADGKKAPPKRDDFTVASSTKIDFDETLIEGKMQAPNGFFLQGRTPQALSQMVKLRSNFRPEVRTSKSGVRSLTR